MKYHVVIPYYYHFYVEAESEEEAITEAHNTEGTMDEYDENGIFVEALPALNQEDTHVEA